MLIYESVINQGITGCYEWEHVFLSLGKCQHSWVCVTGDTFTQPVSGWSHIWLHLNGLRRGLVPELEVGEKK